MTCRIIRPDPRDPEGRKSYLRRQTVETISDVLSIAGAGDTIAIWRLRVEAPPEPILVSRAEIIRLEIEP